MEIKDLAENIVVIDPSPEPGLNQELAKTIDIIRERGESCDVIIDFSGVDIVTSSSLSKLLKLRKLLMDCDRILILCSVSRATKGIFSVTALDSVFKIVLNQHDAVEEIKKQQPTMS